MAARGPYVAYNRFIGNSPILIPLLIIAALALAIWYRPPLLPSTTRSSATHTIADGLYVVALQGLPK